MKSTLETRLASFNAQLVSINDELAALHTRIRELDRVLLLIMGQKNEAEFWLKQLEELEP
jgi:hypothetical protein